MKAEKIVLWHSDGLNSHKAFDLFVKREVQLDEAERDFLKCLYNVHCAVAQRFLEKFPDYKLLGSEDLLHIPPINEELERGLASLYERGWQSISAASLGLEDKGSGMS